MIPRTIHRIWLGGPEPEWLAGFGETWRQPGWELIEWDEQKLELLMPLANQDLFDAAEEIAGEHAGQFRSDLARYEILHRYGGVYVDSDFECLRPLDPLLEGVDCFATWEEQDRWIANGLMGAVPGHQLLTSLIRDLPASVERNRNFRPNRMTGPQFLTHVWRQGGDLLGGGVPVEVDRGLTIFPQAMFFPYGYAEVEEHGPGEDWGDAYAVHHWHNKRRRFGIPVG